MKIRPVGEPSCSMRTVGQKDRQTDTTTVVGFRNFANAPKMMLL
jgi:hypothetical protein